MARRHLTIVIAVLAIFAAACGSGAGPGGSTGSPESAELALVDEFATVDGSTIDLASLQGQDVVLWFWAPW